jgi:3-oxoacid CoA-transferase subunit B
MIVRSCDLPLTGVGCVDRIISYRAVLDVTGAGLVLRELASGETVERLRDLTGAPFAIELES